MAMPAEAPAYHTPEPAVRTPENPDNPVRHTVETVVDHDLPQRAESSSKTPETTVQDEAKNAVQEELSITLNRWRRTFTPPDVVRNDRPSLLKVIAYAASGDWGPKTGLARTLGQLDAWLIGIPGVAVGYYVIWLWERPARRYTAFSLVTTVLWWLNWL